MNSERLDNPNSYETNESKPLLKHVRPIRANYSPRLYQKSEEKEQAEACACSTIASSSSPGKVHIESNKDHKPVISINSPKGKDISASIYINVAAKISSKQTIPKVEFVRDKELSESNGKALQFDTIQKQPFMCADISQESKSTPDSNSNNTSSVSVMVKRSRGRPRKIKSESPNKQTPLISTSPQPVKRHRSSPRNAHMVSKVEKSTPIVAKGEERKFLRSTISTPNSSDAEGNKHVDETHKCNICFKVFSSQTRLQNHMHWHVIRKVFKCPICKKIFQSFGHYIRHQQLHKEKALSQDKSQIKANNESSTFTNIKESKAHTTQSQNSNAKLHKCNICSKTFVYLGRLRTHRLTHVRGHRNQLERPEVADHKCELCDKTFNSFRGLYTHKKMMHKNLFSPGIGKRQYRRRRAYTFDSSDVVDEETREYKCGICERKFKSRRTLFQHKRVHTGEMPFECHVCQKLFRWRSTLVGHCVQVHNENRPYKCKHCCLLFKKLVHLRHHENNHHNDSSSRSQENDKLTSNHNELASNDYDDEMSSQDDLTSCQETGNNAIFDSSQENNQPLYKCTMCDRTFRSIYGVRRHSASHKKARKKRKHDPSPTNYSRRLGRPIRSPNTASVLPTQEPRKKLKRETFTKPKQESPPRRSRQVPKNTMASFPASQSSKSETSPKTQQPDTKKSKQESPIASTSPTIQRNGWIIHERIGDRHIYKCALCTNSERAFAAVSSVRKHVGMIHRDYTENLEEPPGLYDDLPASQPSTSDRSSPPDPGASTSGGSSRSTCTCSSRGKSYVYKNNTLMSLPSNCPVHPKKFLKCKHCEKEFEESQKEKLEEHEFSHELKATKPMGMMYMCFECGEEFALANELMDHHENKH